jgi:uncharacterized protein (TIGR03083 family)
MAAYRGVRERTAAMLADIDDASAAATAVPCCPGWTVVEVVGHMCGVADDVLAGRLDGVGTAPWADAQAARLAPQGLRAVLELWGELGPQLEAIGSAFPARPATQMVFDVTTHEHDLRGALGRPGARELEALAVPLDFIGSSLDGFARAQHLAALELEASEGWSFVAGEGEPVTRLQASAFELFRSFGGRRSRPQVRALAWDGDPEPYLGLFADSPLEPPRESVVE